MAIAPDFGESTYRGSGRLQGKRTSITGGDSGFERAMAPAFAQGGADVVISYLPEEDDAQETARLEREEDCCRQLEDHTISELGGIDVLVSHAARPMAIEGIEDLTTEQLPRTYHTNVFAAFWLCQAAVKHLQPGSSILVTTSVQTYQPSPTLLDHASTKGALLNFTQGLSQEPAPRGIQVNTVAPGPIWTPLIPATWRRRRWKPSERRLRSARRPAGRPGPGPRLPRFARVQLHHR